MLRLKLLGHPQVQIAGDKVTGFHSSKSRALLFLLAVTGRPQARTMLATLFWGDYPEDSAMNNLRRELSNLRKLASDYLVITRESVAFDENSNHWLDVTAFEEGLATLQSKGDVAAGEKAVALYQGGFLEGFHVSDAPDWENWMLAERSRLRQGLERALHRLSTHYGGLGRYDQAIAHAHRLASLDPLREEVHRLLMSFYYHNGERSRALVQYETCRQLLESELGVEPAVETRALYEAIHSDELRAPVETQSSVKQVPVFAARPHPSGLLPDEDEVGTERPIFVGREAQLKQMERHLESAMSGQGKTIFVVGGAGRGKTMLLGEFARRSQERYPDLIVATGHCTAFLGRGDPYLPFRDVLGLLTGGVKAGLVDRENARRLAIHSPYAVQTLIDRAPQLIDVLVPRRALFSGVHPTTRADSERLAQARELIKREPSKIIAPEQSALFGQFTAFLHHLARQRPLLITLDDLQWSDEASISLLFHLSRRLPDSPILIVGSYRPDELAFGHDGDPHPLTKVIDEFRRSFGDVWIDLAAADRTGGRAFVDAVLDSQPNSLGQEFRRSLFRQTGGHPFFTVELLREMEARGDLVQDASGYWRGAGPVDWERLPSRIEAVIAQRIRRLDDDLRRVLDVASVEGERFTVQVLARVMDLDEGRVLRRLASLQKKHLLVHELAEVSLEGRRFTRFQFSHFLFQQYLYRDLGQGERRLLHGGIAVALEDLYAGHTEEVLVSLAHHHAQAGQTEEALPYMLAAGDRARTQNVFREAINHYRRALIVLQEKNDHEGAAHTLMKIGLTYHNASAFEQARAANQDAFRLWRLVQHGEEGGSLRQAPHALRVAWPNFSGKLDPAMVKEAPRALVMQQLFSGLMQLGKDLDILPDLAHRWELLDRGHRYVFHLRADAHWSDGTPVTAADFEFAWKRVLNPATNSPNAAHLFDIKGARAFHLGEEEQDLVGISALDDNTLQVELEQVSPYFPNLLFAEWTKPVPRHAVETYGSAWMEPGNIVTNGPFRLASWKPGEIVIMARNLDYHGSFTGNVERVEIYLGDDPTPQLEMYLADELDVLYTFSRLPPEMQAELREELLTEYRSGPALGTWFVGFVLHRPPFDDPSVRRAFALATDRRTLAGIVRHGSVYPATGGFLSPVHAAYSEGIALPYDPDQARRLMAEAGYPGGHGFPTITMVNGHNAPRVEAELSYLKAQWHQHLGVNLLCETVPEMGTFLQRLRRDPPHMFYVGWAGRYTDPHDFLGAASLIWELARWDDQDYFRLVEEARTVTDWQERMALYRRADRKLIEEAVLLPLTYAHNAFLVKPWVRRFAHAAIDRWFFPEVILEPHQEKSSTGSSVQDTGTV